VACSSSSPGELEPVRAVDSLYSPLAGCLPGAAAVTIETGGENGKAQPLNDLVLSGELAA
jgi:hypothetical protein